MMLRGTCHCGALGFTLETERPLDAIVVRICGCGLCRRHRPRWWSDPRGRFALEVRDRDALACYRFGHGTADFIHCARCGVLVAALTSTPDGPRAVANLNLALDAGVAPQEVPLVAQDETPAVRDARRAANWTPVGHGWPLA